MPLSNFVPRGLGFVHHSIAILYHQVPNPNITIRNFFIAVRQVKGPRTLALAFNTARVGELRISDLVQGLLAPAVLPRTPLQHELLMRLHDAALVVRPLTLSCASATWCRGCWRPPYCRARRCSTSCSCACTTRRWWHAPSPSPQPSP